MEQKGREGTKGFEDPHEAVSDDQLQYLAEAAKQRYESEVAWISMGLPRLRNEDDHCLMPMAREGALW